MGMAVAQPYGYGLRLAVSNLLAVVLSGSVTIRAPVTAPRPLVSLRASQTFLGRNIETNIYRGRAMNRHYNDGKFKYYDFS